MAGAPQSRAWSAKLRAPFAVLGLRSDGQAITELAFLAPSERAQAPADAITERAARELERYLDDPGFRFTVPLAPRGTPFQRRVWDAIAAIPSGRSRTYGELAGDVGSVARSVGQACGSNPIAIIIPCHRVLARGGAVGGFMHCASGDPIAIKRWLLAHENHGRGLF
jgi:methylated-DNA-[protein]-cysteine S-methyltransferase